MNRLKYLLLLLNFTAATTVYSQLLLKNAQVVDVEHKKILQGYDVFCSDGRIISIEKSRQGTVPAGTRIVDGTGKFLVPGLADAHVHFFQSGGLYTRPDAIDLRKHRPHSTEIKWTHDHMDDLLRRYTSAGITSVVDVGASYNFLAQRDSFTGKDHAPLIAMTGPLLTTYTPEPLKGLGNESPFVEISSEETARQAVKDQLGHKADFIKIWFIVLEEDKEAGARKNLPFVKAAIEEAHKNKLRVAVHATERITAQLAVEAGADFLVHNVEDEVVNEGFIQLLKKKNTVLCPTMIVAGGYYKVFGDQYVFTTDELNLSNPETVGSVIDYPLPDTTLAMNYIKAVNSTASRNRRAREDSILIVNLQKLYAGGVTIATGTDAGNIGTQHAGSYFLELKVMQDAGFKPWDLLVASTINPAKAIGRQEDWGSIAKGKQANMILLHANPLDSLANWRKIDVVINKGIVLDPATLINNTPEMLAQQQLNAYNAHDLEAFLAAYADDVEVYDLPGKLVSKGKEKMRQNYQFITRVPGLYCKLLNRIVQGNTVIDHEEIHITGKAPVYGIAIYVVGNGKISKVYFPQ